MESIVALHRNYFGEIISFVTSEGRIISYRKALNEAEDGLIQGIHAIPDVHGKISLMPETNQSFDHYPNLF
ncbi:hypothetical protein [Neobacillus soli]|uniref:hypothetical protein n=1 Tax=Neobacillus soli TaxID=220688 RepID=UPI000824BDC2|nr:hypothetical protein [Neobacillus soli]